MNAFLSSEGTAPLRSLPVLLGLVFPLPTEDPAAAASYFCVEAESGSLTSPMTVGDDALASQGQFVVSPSANQGSATYRVNITNDGQYVIWCRVLAPTYSNDSFYVSVNGGAKDTYDAAEGRWSTNWQWTVVNGRSGGEPLTLDPRIFDLVAGTNEIVFSARDPNTKLDRLIITDDRSYVPLQELVDHATLGQTLQLPAGIYPGNVAIQKDVTIQGAPAGGTILDGCQAGSVVTVGSSAAVTLRNLVIRNGLATKEPGGAGILNRGSLTIVDSMIASNLMSFPQVFGVGGGAICNFGALVISNCDLVENRELPGPAPVATGGGLLNFGVALCDNSRISSNRVWVAAGVENRGTMLLRNCQITKNDGHDVGGIKNYERLTMEGCLVLQNVADGEGGLFNLGNASISSSTFLGNSSAEIGAILNSGSMAITNSTITYNSSFDVGGISTRNGDLTLVNDTIVWNTGHDAGGVSAGFDNRDGVFSRATIFANPPYQDFVGILNSAGWNLVLKGYRDLEVNGPRTGDIFDQDPLLGPLQDNGGPTPTHALLPGSPAIDAGPPADFPATDQRGVLRPRDGNGDWIAVSDIGAVENDDARTNQITSIELLSGGKADLKLLGVVGRTFAVQASDVLPAANWITIATTNAGPTGSFEVIDYDSMNHRNRFYRAVQIAPGS